MTVHNVFKTKSHPRIILKDGSYLPGLLYLSCICYLHSGLICRPFSTLNLAKTQNEVEQQQPARKRFIMFAAGMIEMRSGSMIQCFRGLFRTQSPRPLTSGRETRKKRERNEEKRKRRSDLQSSQWSNAKI